MLRKVRKRAPITRRDLPVRNALPPLKGGLKKSLSRESIHAYRLGMLECGW
jgi:hypothetical protein